MRKIVNDEIDIPLTLTKDRVPTHNLRFYDVGAGRMLLERLWISPCVGVKDQWVPVSFKEAICQETQ